MVRSSLPIVHSQLSLQDFLPDGDLSKGTWKEAKWLRFDGDWSGQNRFPEAETFVAGLWTVPYIYFASRCKYSSLNVYAGEDVAKERWKLWERDVVEVFVNPQPERPNHYYEFEVAPTNQWIDLEIDLDKEPFHDPSWDSGFTHATRIDPKNHEWTCEMRIPVKAMGVEAMRANTEWRINFYRQDGPGTGTERRLLCWRPTFGEKPNFHKPERFGAIRFVGR
jgi:Carbohydrate family 9 binding domain-like